jgi:hypothetical protein
VAGTGAGAPELTSLIGETGLVDEPASQNRGSAMNEEMATRSGTAGVIRPAKTDLYYGEGCHEALSKRRVDVTSPATGKLLGNVADAEAIARRWTCRLATPGSTRPASISSAHRSAVSSNPVLGARNAWGR